MKISLYRKLLTAVFSTVIGGNDKNVAIKTKWKYSISEKSWKKLPVMNVANYGHSWLLL